MTVHDKLSARLRSTPACLRDGNSASSATVYGPWQDAADMLADAIEHGDFDDILGVREPTLEDVKREAVRVYGVAKEYGGAIVYYLDNGVHVGVGSEVCGQHVEVYPVIAPTIAAAYQALRALPDYEEE